MEAPDIETPIPLQRDRWKWKLLKKAANSDIAFWLEHNSKTRQIVQSGRVPNILLSLLSPKEIQQANIRFLTKIIRAKRTMLLDGRTDDETNYPAEQNEEPPD